MMESNMIIRPCRRDDIDRLLALAAKAGKGLTTVPRDRDAMAERIEQSVTSFARTKDQLTTEVYLLVLEEADGTLSGMSAIYTNLGYDQPFYSYRLSRLAARAPEIGVKSEATVLSLVNDFHGYNEMATLFLDPTYRGGGRGTLLSFSRFLLIAAFPDRFSADVMAEMRGWTDEHGVSPFWEAVGRKFFTLDFSEADRLSGISNRFIADLMPKVPIYTTLLPDDAQAVIGKTHEQTRPARALLEKQGFRFRHQVDVFDAGPCMEASTDNIPLIRDARATNLGNLDADDLAVPSLVALPGLETFRATSGMADAKDIAARLGISTADQILYARL